MSRQSQRDLFDGFGLEEATAAIRKLSNNLDTVTRPKVERAVDLVAATTVNVNRVIDTAVIAPTIKKANEVLDIAKIVGVLLAVYLLVSLIRRVRSLVNSSL